MGTGNNANIQNNMARVMHRYLIFGHVGEEHLILVPFVNRPFESEIHGTVNFTQFCCVLLVTWCYRVLLSCYLRPK